MTNSEKKCIYIYVGQAYSEDREVICSNELLHCYFTAEVTHLGGLPATLEKTLSRWSLSRVGPDAVIASADRREKVYYSQSSEQ